MKNNIKTRFRKLRNFIYDEKTRGKCRLNDEEHKHIFTRNRKIPFYDILLLTLNKQGKNVFFAMLLLIFNTFYTKSKIIQHLFCTKSKITNNVFDTKSKITLKIKKIIHFIFLFYKNIIKLINNTQKFHKFMV